MKVENVMTKNVWTCRAEDSLSIAARLMWDHDIGAVPVHGAEGAKADERDQRDAGRCR